MALLRHVLALLLLLFSGVSATMAAAQNVTDLLAAHPDYSTFSRLLLQYGVAAQINSRTAITVLCPSNELLDPYVASLGNSPDRQTVFDVLSFHVLLDYEDPAKIAALPGGATTVATLFQTTGLASASNGFVNLTYFGGAARVRRFGVADYATIGATLALFPYNISLLTIDEVLVPAGLGVAPPSPPVNITQILAQAGKLSRFVALLVATGVDKIFLQHAPPPGITIFAPSDAAFLKLPPLYTSISAAQQVALLEFHATASFFPSQELAVANGPQPTLASGSGGGAFTFTVSQENSGTIYINAGYNVVPISATLYSNNPVAIFIVDSVLLPTEIFGTAPPPTSMTAAPTPTIAMSTAPTSAIPSPSSAAAVTPSTVPPMISSTPKASAPSITPVSTPPAPPPSPSTIILSPTSPTNYGPQASSPLTPTSFASPLQYYPGIIFLAAAAASAFMI